jgi:Zn-dependent protease with chaperone function
VEYVPNIEHTTPHLGDSQQCPKCNASVPVSRGYVAWCEHCGWNVQPYDPNPPRNIFEAKYAQLGKKFSRQLLDRMRDEKNLRSVLTPSLVAAFGIAALVHLVTIALALTGIVLLFAGNCVLFAIGIVFLAMVWVLRPHFRKVPKNGIASREEFPTLYRMSDQVAKAIGAPPVNMIRLGGQFNASFSQPGFPRTRVMYLGLPLFSILDAQEWVALLGHELGHCVNGDVSRTLVVGMAIDSLVGWYKLFYPGRIWDRRGFGIGFGGLVGLAAIPANLLMLGLAQVAKFWVYALVNLLWSNRQ